MSSAQLNKFKRVKPADIQWRDGLPYSLEFDDVYFSEYGAVEESSYVFIQGNRLLEEWKKDQASFNLLELGFGSGLNFFNTANYWQKHQQKNNTKQRLNYIAIEKRPLSIDDFNQCRAKWPELQWISDQLTRHYPAPLYGRVQIDFPQLNLTLTLMLMPVEEALDDLLIEFNQQQPNNKIDHWFLDGFSPSKNQAMWSEAIAEKMARLSKKASRFATYSVAGSIRRALTQAGFKVEKIKGFGQKKHMLVGYLEKEFNQTHSRVNIKYEKPWFNWKNRTAEKSNENKKIAIVGSGIAGCTTAYLLAQRGYQCHLYEAGQILTSEASAAACGIYHPSLTSDFNFSSQFNWVAFQTLTKFLSEETKRAFFHTQGLIRYLKDHQAEQRIMQLAEELNLTSLKTGVQKGLYFPQAGAINMAHYCQWLLSEIPKTQLFIHNPSRVLDIKSTHQGWQLLMDSSVASKRVSKDYYPHDFYPRDYYPHIIDCRGAAALTQGQFNCERESSFDHLHLTAGQTCQFHSSRLAKQVKGVLCGQVYLIPLDGEEFILGSSFEDPAAHAGSDHLSLKADIQNQLLDQLNQLLEQSDIPMLSKLERQKITLKGKRAFRLHTQDRLPLVGPAMDQSKLRQDFSQLGQKRLLRNQLSHYNQPGFWLNTAYGSHGLLFSLLASQHLVSLISGEISPLNSNLAHAIHPARFIIRQLKHQ